MAIGRTFAESLQKALRGLETGLSGLDEIDIPGTSDPDTAHAAVLRALAMPTPERLLVIAQAFRHGLTVEEIHGACSYEPWFLRQIAEIVRQEGKVRASGLPAADGLRKLKAMGFSDARLAKLTSLTELEVRARRHAMNIRPVFKRIDTCAGEFAATTPYMYSTYETGALGQAPDCEAEPSSRKKAIILGGGPNRIGQGIEFDYCCCHAAFALDAIGIESIMVNCNPETVSTDYDTSDRLYFEPLTAEDVLELIHVEQKAGTLAGVIVQFGGQTPPRPDAAEAGPSAGAGRHPDPRHQPRRHRPGRGPRALPAAAAPAGHQPAGQRPGPQRRGMLHRRGRGRLSDRHPAVLCAGRTGHGDHPRRRATRALRAHRR